MRLRVEQTPNRFPAGFLPVFVLGCFLAGYLLLNLLGGAELCWFKALTGVNCPTCGLSRSLLSLLGGDPLAALRFNPFMLLLTLVVLAQLALTVIFRRRVVLDASPRARTALWIAIILLFIANWIYVIVSV